MPHYSLEELQGLVAQDAFTPATTRARHKLIELGYTHGDLRASITALQEQDFRKTWEMPAACDFGDLVVDVYKLVDFDRATGARCPQGDGDSLYFKLAIHENEDGALCAVVSIHLDGAP